jgi:hypothetical protein
MPLFAHVGVGLMSKKILPKMPGWALVVCAMGIDIMAGVLFWAPIWTSHGLVMSIVWSILAALITALCLKSKSNQESQSENSNSKTSDSLMKTTIVVGILVFSHWVLDFIGWPMIAFGFEDRGVPLLFDLSPNAGLGVYRTLAGGLIFEIVVLSLGILIYYQTIKEMNKVNKVNK